jgi:hypothetical protein
MTQMALSPHDAANSVPSDNDVAGRAERLKREPDDMAMIRAAAELTRDLNTPNARIYWTDFLASALIGYAALAMAIVAAPLWLKVALSTK